MKVEVGFEFKVFCQCGKELEVKSVDDSSPYYIVVSSCSECTAESYEEGREAHE